MGREGGPNLGLEHYRSAEHGVDIPDRLRSLHEVERHFLAHGVFFDVYALRMPNEQGEEESFVFKDFRSGDITMSPEEQIALFQHQYYEWVMLKFHVGKEFFPESHWIRSSEFSDDEAHGFYSVVGKTANTMEMFLKVQLDRQLANRYSSDDKKKGVVKDLLSQLGSSLVSTHETKPFIGAIVQRRINGATFAEVLPHLDKNHANYPLLRSNTQALIAGLRAYQTSNDYGVFTWHGLGSDNVMVELGEDRQITGRVFVIDANFTERPNSTFKQAVAAKLEHDVFQSLERAFALE